jgi:two-component system, NtrC family, sensor kinase
MTLRTLLVDDEISFRETVAKRLKKRGIEVGEAGGGEEALVFLDRNPVDVVVLDVKMPGIDGVETLRRVKEKHPDTEVILLTGHASTRDGVEGIKGGAYDYLTKPLEFEHLLNKIRQAYDKVESVRGARWEAELRANMNQRMTACERLASLGTLAVGVAHEINNPLAIINEAAGWVKLLLERPSLSDMPHKADFALALSKIERSVERTKRITHQLLEFARRSDSPVSEVNLSELADDAIQLVGREAVNRGIEIEKAVEPSLRPVWSDPFQLRQVFLNLLANAVYATAPGGKITVRLRTEGKEAVFTVTDTGIGIPRENLDKIFEPFFTTKAPGEGTGLGLFVSRGIMDRLGGGIGVESRLGKGSTFSVRLPSRPEIPEIGVRSDKPLKGENE